MIAHFYSNYRSHWIRRLYEGPLARYLDGFATFRNLDKQLSVLRERT